MADDFTKSVLNYRVGSPTPIRRVSSHRAPSASDYKNFVPGDEWLDKSSDDWWKFIERQGTPSQGLWVKIGGTGAAVETFTVDDATAPGVNPVEPNGSNDITVTGAQVASGVVGANVIRTHSTDENEYAIEIQRTTTASSADEDLNGVSHFDSDAFTVSAEGFVGLIGGGQAIVSFEPDSGTSPVVPDANGQISVLGQSTPNTSGIQVSGGTNQLDVSMFSPFEGDFAFTQSNASMALGVKLLVANSDTTDPASDAQVIMSVGGSSSGDAHSLWSVGSTRSYSLGPDTSDSEILKLTTDDSGAVTPSTGTTLAEFTPESGGTGASVVFPVASGAVILSRAGLGVDLESINSDNTNSASHARIRVANGGSSSGDVLFACSGGTQAESFAWGTKASNGFLEMYQNYNPSTGGLNGNLIYRYDPTPSALSAPFSPIALFDNTNMLRLRNSSEGQRVTILCSNNDTNDGASNAALIAETPTGGGDAFSEWNANGNDWVLGQAATDHTLRLGHGSPPSGLSGGLQCMTVISSIDSGGRPYGVFTFNHQPALRAISAAAQENVTGDGETVTVVFGTAVTNQSFSYATGTGILTIPVTGFYSFSANVVLSDLTASHTTGVVSIISTANGRIAGFEGSFANLRDAADQVVINVAGSMLLAASDTVFVEVTVSGGTTVVDIENGISTNFTAWKNG